MAADRTPTAHALRGRAVAVAVALAVALLAAFAPGAAARDLGGSTTSGPLVDSPHPRIVTTGCASGPVGRRVLVVGDSITVFTQTTLTRMLTSAGWSVCLDAQRSQTTAGMLDGYRDAGAFPSYVDIIVMAVGSNDVLNPSPFVAQVARARQYAAGRPLLWFTTWVRPTAFAPSISARYLVGSERVNAVIWKYVERARRGSVIDWHASVAAGPSRARAYLADGVHPTDLGGRQRAAMLVTALRRLH